MTVKNPLPPVAVRQVKRLRARLAKADKLRHQAQREHDQFRLNAGRLLEGYLSTNRRLTETCASNNMTITELEQQVGIQQRMVAEAQQDAQQAVTQHNRGVRKVRDLEWSLIEREKEVGYLQGELDDARQRFAYRVWVLLLQRVARYQEWRKGLRSRLLNWWVVRRLNAPRVSAMSEAGYIPEKLIKVARDYWELDKGRTGEIIQELDSQGYVNVEKRQTLWRRLRILMGRA